MLHDETCIPSLSNLYVFQYIFTLICCMYFVYTCMHAPITLSLPEFILVRLVTDSNRNRSSPFAYRDEVFSRGAFVAVATVLVGPGGEQHPHPWLFIMFKRNCKDTQGNHQLGYFSKNISRQVLQVILRIWHRLTLIFHKKSMQLSKKQLDWIWERQDVGPFANCQSVTWTSCVLTNSIVSQQKVYEIDVNEVLRNRSHHGDVVETGQKVLTDTVYSFHRYIHDSSTYVELSWYGTDRSEM